MALIHYIIIYKTSNIFWQNVYMYGGLIVIIAIIIYPN